ncbi:MAG: glycosyltransferase [Deferrisomatales bacterium]|nr:glycosyltransferase [Deferrisomatales bacterium]
METHVCQGFAELGWRIRHFDCRRLTGFHPRLDRAANSLLRLLIREPERLRETSLLRAIETTQPDLILVLLGNQLSPKTVAAIRARFRVPVVAWCQDAMVNMDRQYLIGAEYDHVFVKDHYMVRFLRDMAGLPSVHYLPEACNPHVHRTVELSDGDRERYAADVMTYGSLYYYRQAILTALKEFDLKIWGAKPDWLVDRLPGRHLGRGIFEEEKCKAVHAASITLNTLHYGEVEGLNARAFEIAGIGGFQLLSHSPVVEDHFVVGREVETFSSRKELVEKVRYYLGEPEKMATIAAAGQRRAYAEHTFCHRLQELTLVSDVG